MAGRGTEFGGERITMTDAETGAQYTQVSNAPVNSIVVYYENPSFTADNETMLFHSQRIAMRGAPWDLFRVDADGTNLVQLTDEAHPLRNPRPAPDRPRVLYGVRESSLISLDIDTFEETEIARCEGATALGERGEVDGALTGDGVCYVAIGRRASDGAPLIVRFRTDGTEVVTLCEGLPECHLTANATGTILLFSGLWEGGTRVPLACDINGDRIRPTAFRDYAHCTWLGRTDVLQKTLLPPGHGIVTCGIDEPDPTPVCAGPYFWHSASSEDGEWLVSDTNWPDEGIMLVHVPTGRYAALVKPRSDIGHQQETHPHPSFNRDGTKVVFTSNQTGLSQVYVCDVPDVIRQEILSGDISNRVRIRR